MKNKKEDQWNPEKFPKPNTFPSGWDGSGLMPSNVTRLPDGTLVPIKRNTDASDWRPEKFPKPRTFPKNWSVDD
jgi:hypothetical protein